MVRRIGVLLKSLLLILILVSPLTYLLVYSETSSDNNCYIYKIYIPAVSERGFGESVETNILVIKGGGEIHIVGTSAIGLDTLISLLIAYIYSYDINSSFFKNYSIYMILPSGTTSVKGPSAGAYLTYVLTSISLRGYVPLNISGTGAINLDGTIENVGGVPEKIRALENTGVIRNIIIPSSTAIYYEKSLSRVNLNITPVSNIIDLLTSYGINGNITKIIYTKLNYEENDTDYLQNISYDYSNYEKELLDAYNFIKSIAYSRNLSLSYETRFLESTYMNLPREDSYSYARINTLFLMILSGYREVLSQLSYVDRDLYNEIVSDLIKEIEDSKMLLSRFILDTRKILEPKLITLYIIFIKRSLDLVDLYERNNGFRNNVINTSDLVYAYARSLSLRYWYDLIERYTQYYSNITHPFMRWGINDLRDSIDKVYKFLNSSGSLKENNKLIDKLINFTNINRSIISQYDYLFIKLIINLVYLNELFENYSYSLRYSSISAVYLSSGDNGLERLFRQYNYLSSAEYFSEIFSPTYLRNMFTYSLYTLSNSSFYNTTIITSTMRVLAEAESLVFVLRILLNPESIPNIYLEPKLSLDTYGCIGSQSIKPGSTLTFPGLNRSFLEKELINLIILIVVSIGSIVILVLSRDLVD